jgi:hypothetical protein
VSPRASRPEGSVPLILPAEAVPRPPTRTG